jgi:hypothetical protein
LRNADFIRSRLSFTALSGKPTTFKVRHARGTHVHFHLDEILVDPVHEGADRFEEHLRGLPEKRTADSNEVRWEMTVGSAPWVNHVVNTR